MKVKCISLEDEKSLLELGKIYTAEKGNNNRLHINVFEGKEDDYQPMIGSYDAGRFEIIEE